MLFASSQPSLCTLLLAAFGFCAVTGADDHSIFRLCIIFVWMCVYTTIMGHWVTRYVLLLFCLLFGVFALCS